MAVSVKKPEVVIPVVLVIAVQVVNFQYVMWGEVGLAVIASPFVPQEQISHLSSDSWVLSHSGAPVSPIAIVGTLDSLYFYVSDDLCPTISKKRMPFWGGKVPFGLAVCSPVFVRLFFVAVSSDRPGPQSLVHEVVELSVDFPTAYCSIVVGPSPYEGVELGNERALGSIPIGLNYPFYLLQMCLDRLW